MKRFLLLGLLLVLMLIADNAGYGIVALFSAFAFGITLAGCFDESL